MYTQTLNKLKSNNFRNSGTLMNILHGLYKSSSNKSEAGRTVFIFQAVKAAELRKVWRRSV